MFIWHLIKAIPHKDCAHIAQSDFSADCTNFLQTYCRMSKRIRAV